jgi:hypothetical protein
LEFFVSLLYVSEGMLGDTVVTAPMSRCFEEVLLSLAQLIDLELSLMLGVGNFLLKIVDL